MELLNDSDGGDPISRVLNLIRVRSTIYCRSVMCAPWGFGVRAHGNPAFHVVSGDGCWLEVAGTPEQMWLEAGDLVVLPRGPAHWVRDDPATAAIDLDDLLAATPLDRGRLRHGGSGRQTRLLCGGFTLEGDGGHPLLRALPPAVRVPGVGGHPAPWVAGTLALLDTETASDAPGAEQVVSRLADALLIQALRATLVELQDGASTAALADPRIARAIELIHGAPERRWTVGELAAEVALSRSAFTAQFRRLVGEPPRRYITRTRLAHAATLLSTTDAPLARIAARVGYADEFSFSRAFKRAFGVSPGSYRAA